MREDGRYLNEKIRTFAKASNRWDGGEHLRNSRESMSEADYLKNVEMSPSYLRPVPSSVVSWASSFSRYDPFLWVSPAV